ncbi:hypothetical protein [Streptomyces hygroscopicus]|uniref:hypothetical protein n=1 Tax=Streptomyces hygroscopicus TaxID=1912 RepID=UPI001FCBCC63|nr:hypothetical protein [Streptomyces hygroscopicus]BDH12840.1 hypothetical protein HOK021_40190 [Streptomyces hygroscopicus]
MVDVGLAAVAVIATVIVMNGGGRFHRRHLLAEARRHLALVLRGRRRDPGLDQQIVDAALACWASANRRSCAAGCRRPASTPPGGAPADIAPARYPPVAAYRSPDQQPGEREIPRVPLRHERAVLASAVLREKLLTTTAVRGRAYDVAAHQQGTMPELLFLHQEAGPGPGRREPETGPESAIDLTALRALKEFRTDFAMPTGRRPTLCPATNATLQAGPLAPARAAWPGRRGSPQRAASLARRTGTGCVVRVPSPLRSW